jgi:LPS-assembly protein
MRNNILYIFLFSIFFLNLSAQELEINSNKAKYDNIKKITLLEGEVNLEDEKGNKLFSEYAEYNELDELVKTVGKTKIITSNNFEALGSNIIFDNKKKIIYSNYKTQIKDNDGNKILVDMFSYSISTNIFFSKGNIEIFDVNNNNYKFSEIYIDENRKKIIGSDVKAFLKQESLSLAVNNEPRFFANTMSLNKGVNTFDKGIFTYCKNRENEKCPPWVLKSSKIKHDLASKTVYYDNVVLKVYDFPIFFAPKFSHPDPTVKRRSGLLAPSLTNSSTLGAGFSVPYFWNLANDRDLTLTPKLFLNENPLMLAEFRQDFQNSFLTIDAGYTKGFKKKNKKKSDGARTHFFSKYSLNLIDEKEKKSNLEVNIQKTSNDTYFKIYDVDTTLVDKNQNILENSIDFVYQNKDFYLGATPGIYEDTTKNANSRHEYLLPLAIEKNLMVSEKYGFLDLETNLEVRNSDTNKQSNILVNDFNWKSNKWLNKLGFENYFEVQTKNVNYDTKNTEVYKNDEANYELNSALGYFAKLALFKEDLINKNFYTLSPKFLLRYAPGHMRDLKSGKFNYDNLFNLNKVNNIDVIETGLSTSIGLEYKKNKIDNKGHIDNEIFSLNIGQVIRKEENMDIPSSTSLDQKFSDIVGKSKYRLNKNLNLNYKFSVDQSYKEFNYNEVGADLNFDKAKFNISYLQEKNHIGNQELVQSGIDFKLNSSTELSFSTKRNLLTNSSEFYNLSYNYINDCLTAGIAYRREFYTDEDVEPVNTLMFTISIIPFATVNTPSFKR